MAPGLGRTGRWPAPRPWRPALQASAWRGMSAMKPALVLPALALAGALLAPWGAAGQEPAPVTTWARTYGSSQAEAAWCVEATQDGGYAVAGWSESVAGSAMSAWVLKLDQLGGVQWQKAYASAWVLGSFISQTPQGEYALAGYTSASGAGGMDYWVARLYASGEIAWQKTYGGARDETAVSVIPTQDGGFLAAGETQSFGAGDWDIWLVKLADSGEVQWQKTLGGPAIDTTSADPVVQTSDGGYVVIGRTQSFGAGGYDFWVLKLSAQGEIQWQRAYGGPLDDEAKAVRATSDGGYIVAGHSQSFGSAGWDVWLVKLSAQGEILWQKVLGGGGNDLAWSVVEGPDQGYVAAADTRSFGAGDQDAWLVKFDQDGSLAWQKTYGGPWHDGSGSVRPAADGGYVLAGETRSSANRPFDVRVLKTDAMGDLEQCALVADSTASPRDSDAVITETNAVVHDTDAQVAPALTGAVDTQAQESHQCGPGS